VSGANDEVVVIIGGSSGIGREIAGRVAAAGYGLVVVGRDRAKLDAVEHDLGARVRTAALDAHDADAVEDLFGGLDGIDHVVSLVGDSMSGGFLDTPDETMRHVLHSKFWSNWQIGRAAAPKLRDGGSLTFTSGTGGRPHDISASYVANLGVAALVQGLAVELAPNIRVNAVAPTFMGAGTAFWRALAEDELDAMQAGFAGTVPLARLATAREVASTYIHLMDNGFITGQVIAVDGGVML
jgi:NAD(P)-dependent dehydrogenase (short-subunit alcohol dehydrogenase family)